MSEIPKSIVRLDALNNRLLSINRRSMRLVFELQNGLDTWAVAPEELNSLKAVGRAARDGANICEQIRNEWIDAGMFRFMINFGMRRSCQKTEILADFMESFLSSYELGDRSGRLEAKEWLDAKFNRA